jgi:hypothetical protein
MEVLVIKEEYTKIGEKTTVCLLTLKNGYEIAGYSACVDPKMFDYEIGKHWAKENAKQKLEEIVGYLMQEALFHG